MAVTATRTTSLFNDANGDGKVTPGDTLLTEILLKNATANPLTTVTVNDSLTSNTTYVAGSTVVTTGDAYSLTGNTPITFGTAQGLLANDYHFDGVNAGTNTGLVVTTVNGTAVGAPITVFDAANNALTAGTVNVAADGSFTFTPATGYTGTASFSYTDSDGSGTVGHGTVNLAVNGLVWYVDSGASAAGADGSYLHPFTTLAPVSAVDHINDTIVLHGTVTGGITLKGGETFYGDGSTFSVNGHQITNAGTDSVINHSTSGIVVASGNTIDGIDLVGTAAGATGITDSGATAGNLTVNHMAISGQGQIIDVDQGGALNVTLKSAASTTFTTAAQGGVLDLQGVTGSFTVSGGTTISGVQTSGGIDVNGGAGFVATFTGAASVNTGAGNAVTVAAGTATFSAAATVTTTTGAAVTMSGGAANFNGGATISATTGAGLTTTGGTLNIASGSIATTTGHIVDMTNTTVGTVALSSLTSSAAVVGSAIKMDNVDGGTFGATTVTVAGASGDGLHIGTGSATAFTFGNTSVTAITAGNQGIDISGNTTAAGAANVTFNGTVNVNTAATSAAGILLDNNNGSVSFSGTSVTVNTGGGNGITISNNGATVGFTGGGLNVDSTTGTAFSATGGGTLNITSGAGGVNTNSIVSTTGRAVNIDSVTSNVTLHDVSAGGGSTTGIFLRGTGAGGQFLITGTGTTAASGGILHDIGGADGTLGGQATAGTGIYLENVANVSISNMNFTGTFSNFGIRGESVNNFTLKDSNLTGTFGGNVGLGEDAIRFGTQAGSPGLPNGTTGLTGTALFSGNVIQGGKEHNLSDYTYGSSTLNMTIQDSAANQATFNANDTLNGGNHVMVETGGTSHLTFTSTNVTYNASHDTAVNILSLAQTVQTISITGNTFANTMAQTSGAAAIRIAGSLAGGTVGYTIDNNTMKGSNGASIASSFNGTSGAITGHITNNVEGTPGNGVYDAALASTGALNGGFFIGGIDGKQSSAGTLKYDLNISNNTIADHNSVAGAILIRSSADDNTGTERVEATINSNVIEQGGPNMSTGNTGAIYLQPAGSSLTAYGTIGVNINSNTFNLTGNTNASGLLVDGTNGSNVTLYLPGISPTSAAGAAAAINSYLLGKGNTFTNTSPNVGYFASFGVQGTALQDPVPLTATGPNQGLGWEDLLPAVKDPSDPIVTTPPADATGGGGAGGTGSTGGGTPPPPPAPPPVVTDALTQSALDQMVAAAIHRWELAGATPEQIAAMKAVSVTISSISGLVVGDSTPGHIQVSSGAAGYGWFVDATPDEDSEFTGAGSDLTAPAGTAAAGHVDLLTVLEHELGHQIGLDDRYGPTDAADLMYGYVNPGERRLPTGDDVHAATGTPVDHESFALSPVTIASLAANTNVDVSFRSTVNAFAAGLAPTLTGSSSITWQGNVTPLTASETTNNVNTSRTDSGGAVTTGTPAEATLTLGNLVFKDNDKSGTFNAGDTGIGNVTVKLYVDTNANGVYDAGTDVFVATTTTSNIAGTLGQYSFTGLAPGDYVVVIPAANFGAGVLGALVPHNGALDPDNNVDNDNNGSNVAGGDVASQAITLAYDTEVTNGAGNDTNNTLDFGFQVNTPPVANADTLAATDEDTPKTYAASDFTGNDSDPDGDTFTITGVTNGSHGTAVLNGNGTVTYTPTGNYNGSDTFTYTITDSHGATATANATVTVNAVNDPVTGTAPATATVDEDSSGNPIAGMSISDVDATLAPGGIYQVTVAATHGTLTLTTLTGLTFSAGDGTTDPTMTFSGTLANINTALASAHYTPDGNYNGAAQIQLDVTDSFGGIVATGTGSATNDTDVIAVTVNSVNDAPSVTNEAASTNDAIDHIFSSAEFTAHFSDPNDTPANAPLNVIITSLPATGTLTYNGTAITLGQLPYTVSLTDIDAGKLHYAPVAGTAGNDYTFGFKVQDDGGIAHGGQDTSSAHTFTMHMLASDFAPVLDLNGADPGIDNSAAYTEQAAPTILASGLSLTDSDNANLSGATVSIGTGFIANADYLSVNGATSGTVGTISFAYNAATGVLSLTGTATVAQYQSALAQVGFESTADAPGTSRDIAWTATDGTLPSTTAHTTVTVTPVNDAPSGADATLTFNEDATRILHASDFGYTDPEGNPLGSVTISTVSGGTLYYDSDGAGVNPPVAVSTYPATFTAADLAADKVTFVPTPDVNGTGVGSIVFAVTDNSGQANDTDTSPNTLTIDLTAVNDAPVASGTATAATIAEDTPLAAGETVASLFSGNFSDAADDQTAHTGGSSPNSLAGVAVTGNASSAGTGHWQYWDGASWVDISTSVTASTALLLSASTAIRFNPAQDYNGAAPALTVTLVDSSAAVSTGNSVDLSGPGATGGTTAYSSGSVALGETITAVNDAPVNAVPGAQPVDEDATLTFSSGNSNAITVSDVDTGAGDLTTTVSALHGTVTLGSTANVAVTGDGTGSVQVTGTAANINAALAGLTYAPTANYNGGDTLTVLTSDNGNTGTGGAKTDTDAVAITVNAVNDQPVVSDGADIAATEQTAITVNASTSISDIDLDAFNGGNGDYAGATLTYDRSGGANAEDSFTIPNGAGFTVSGNDLLAGGLVFATFTTSAVPGELKITFTSSGTPATTALVNAVAQAVQYADTSDAPPGAIDIVYTLNDGSVVNNNQGSNASPFNAFDPGFVHATITAVNDAPVNAVPGAQTLAEDGSKTFNSANSNLISVSDADAGGGNLTVTVSVAHGTLILSGTAGLGFGTGDGTADATMTFTGTAAAINTALNGLVYTPTGDFNGDDTLTLTTNDTGNTGTGGAKSDLDTVTLHVTAVNDAPVASGSATAPAIDEDAPSATGNSVGSLFAANYSDAADNQSAYGGSFPGAMGGIAITANASGAAGQWQYWNGASWVNVGAVSASSALTLSAGTAIRFNPAQDYSGAAPTLTVHLADNTVSISDGAHIDLSGVGATGGTTAWSMGTVALGETVNPVNDAPVLDLNGAGAGTSSTLNYTEGQSYKLVAPSATVTDGDSPNYDNGVLTLAFTANGTSDDQLAIIDHGVMNTGDISVSDNAIYYQFGFVVATGDPNNPYDYSNSDIRFIGTFTGGTGGSDLVITFNDQVTPAIAQAVLADIGYENISNNPSTLARTVTVTLAEADGATSSPTTVTINVTAIDNPAVIQSDTAFTDEAHSVNIAVLANDNDSDGPPPSVAKINGQNVVPGQTVVLASGALATLNADGTITYDPYHKFDTLTSTAGGETGASNTQGVDTFTYTSADGSVGTVTVSIAGIAGPGDWLRGSDGNDTITGTPNNDLFMLQDGGTDNAYGGNGNDIFYYGAAFDAADHNDGGDGRDAVVLQGDYWGGNKVTLGDHALDNIEALSLQSGSVTRWGDTANNLYSYDVTTVDANVAVGQQLIVNASALLSGENFTFDGSAETDGKFLVYGGEGTDHLTGGAGADIFFFEGDRWNPTDTVDGGGGRDGVIVTGSSNGVNHIVVGAGQLVNVEALSVSPVYATNPTVTPSYDIFLNDGNTPAGGSLIVNASTLTSAIQTFSLDAHLVTGNLVVFGGAGADTIVTGSGNDQIHGAGGADILTGGAGADQFQYRDVTDSSTSAADHILDFTPGTDKIDLHFIDANPATPGDDAFVWSNDGTFHGISGEVREFFDAGHGWWVLDADVNGDGQADLTIHITTVGNAPLVHGDVIL